MISDSANPFLRPTPWDVVWHFSSPPIPSKRSKNSAVVIILSDEEIICCHFFQFILQKSSYSSINHCLDLILLLICWVFSNSNNHDNAVMACDTALQNRCKKHWTKFMVKGVCNPWVQRILISISVKLQWNKNTCKCLELML